MQFRILIFVGALACHELVSRATAQSMLVISSHAVEVSVAPPSDIEFAFETTDYFVPLTLFVQKQFEPHASKTRKFAKHFQISDGSEVIVFRNTLDQSFRDNDVFLVNLEYSDKNGLTSRWTTFKYTVENGERNAILQIQTESEIDMESAVKFEALQQPQPFELPLQPSVSSRGDAINLPNLDRLTQSLPDFLHNDVANIISQLISNETGNFTWFDFTSIQEPHQQSQRPPQQHSKPWHFADTISPPTSPPTSRQQGEIKSSVKDIFKQPDPESNRSYNATKTEPDYRDELLRTAVMLGRFQRRLLLTGDALSLVINSHASDIIGNIIIGDLHLPHLVPNILIAQFVHEGLLFEMATAKDVVEILTQARLLRDSRKWGYDIQLSDMDFIEVSLYQRSKN